MASGKSTQAKKSFLNMAGEFLVAGELNRREVLAAVTYGASKAADIFAMSPSSGKYAVVEVKTTEEKPRGKSHWVTGHKIYAAVPNMFWVFVLLPTPLGCSPSTLAENPLDDQLRGKHAPRYFILSSREAAKLARRLHDKYSAEYEKRHSGKPYPVEGGVPQVSLSDIEAWEMDWEKIVLTVNGTQSAASSKSSNLSQSLKTVTG